VDHSEDNRLETVNVRLPDELIKVLDQLVAKGIFANRSEAIREFAREYVLEERRHGGAN
jgi:Arc/MetJ-type ribon-helix-helix transcriptional regulator